MLTYVPQTVKLFLASPEDADCCVNFRMCVRVYNYGCTCLMLQYILLLVYKY